MFIKKQLIINSLPKQPIYSVQHGQEQLHELLNLRKLIHFTAKVVLFRGQVFVKNTIFSTNTK